jgi:hypothetical protein
MVRGQRHKLIRLGEKQPVATYQKTAGSFTDKGRKSGFEFARFDCIQD